MTRARQARISHGRTDRCRSNRPGIIPGVYRTGIPAGLIRGMYGMGHGRGPGRHRGPTGARPKGGLARGGSFQTKRDGPFDRSHCAWHTCYFARKPGCIPREESLHNQTGCMQDCPGVLRCSCRVPIGLTEKGVVERDRPEVVGSLRLQRAASSRPFFVRWRIRAAGWRMWEKP